MPRTALGAKAFHQASMKIIVAAIVVKEAQPVFQTRRKFE